MQEYLTHSEAETEQAGADFARALPDGKVVAMYGELGSGKTACALAAIYLALKNHCQAVLMAPTEILASQHYADLAPMLEGFGFRVEKLTG